jgi:hypothetical protein
VKSIMTSEFQQRLEQPGADDGWLVPRSKDYAQSHTGRGRSDLEGLLALSMATVGEFPA